MNLKALKFNGFTGNQLKILALITMTIDHIGYMLIPSDIAIYDICRIIGRIAFPIFAYMIAQGCHYTRNRKKYILTVAFFALLCQLVYGFAMGSLYQCVLVTFTLSIALIYLLDHALKKRTALSTALAVTGFLAAFFICEILPKLLSDTNFRIDYGFFGVLLPVFAYFDILEKKKLSYFAAGLVILSLSNSILQCFSLLSLIPLYMYNGKRGRLKMKNLFYIYYPLHLVVIYAFKYVLFYIQTH